MKAKHLFYLVLLGTAVACSAPQEEAALPPAPSLLTRSVRFQSENLKDYTIFAFLEGDNGFAYLNTFPSSGRADGQTEVQLPVGNYQFIVASGFGHSILPEPQHPVQAATLAGDMRFKAQTTAENAASLQPGEELFLPDAKADSVYPLYTASNIQINLKRAVSQALIYIKRGRKIGENIYEALPYSQDSIVRYFSRVELQLENAGTAVDAHSTSSGEAPLVVTYPAAARDSITPEGFAAFTGPFFFPPAGNVPLQFSVKLYPSANSPLPELSLSTTGKAARNERLIITVWITQDWNFIGVTADTSPIQKENTGDSGIWDDIITPQN